MEREESFRFSEDLLSGISQISTHLPIGSADLSQPTFYGDSQSTIYPASQVGRSSMVRDAVVPSIEPKKAKLSQPKKWAKDLLKTAEDNQKLRNYDAMAKRHEEVRELRLQLSELQAFVFKFPSVMRQSIEESTNHITSSMKLELQHLQLALLNVTKKQDEQLAFQKKMMQEYFFDLTATITEASSCRSKFEADALQKLENQCAILKAITSAPDVGSIIKMLTDISTQMSQLLEGSKQFETELLQKVAVEVGKIVNRPVSSHPLGHACNVPISSHTKSPVRSADLSRNLTSLDAASRIVEKQPKRKLVDDDEDDIMIFEA